MPKYNLEVIPEPEKNTRVILVNINKIPVFKGQGDDNYYCGSCGFLLCEKIHRTQIKNIVLKCPGCKAFNEIRGD